MHIIGKALAIIVLAALGGIYLLPSSSCGKPLPGGHTAASPAVAPARPPIDNLPHGPLQTAYFAMG